MNETTSQLLLRQYLGGSDQAATRLHDRFVDRLIALARSRLAPSLAPRFDPEDIVQSAYRSFFVAARNQRFTLSRGGDLWRLLAQITLNKLRTAAEWNRAGPRDIRRERPTDDEAAALASEDPGPAEVAGTIDVLVELMGTLTPQERTVLELRLRGESSSEIARTIGRTDRTVRRIQERIAKQAARQFSDLLRPSSQSSPLAANAPRAVSPPNPAAEFHWMDFRIQQHLGTGGMGKVYRALHHETGRVVALKALRKDRQADPAAVERFLREVVLVSRLSHPGIVPILGRGRFPAGGWFLVQKLIDGETLETCSRRQPLEVCRLVEVVRQVAVAIHHAHTQGVLHCDVTPRNVLIARDQSVHVVDFGLGQLQRAAPRKDSPFTPAGTPAFLAPEQLDATRGPLSRATDVYGLGGLLYFGLTGHPPREIKTSVDLPRLLALPISFPSSVPHNSVTARLWEICRHCLEVEPGRRPATAEEVAHRLEAITAGPESPSPSDNSASSTR